jgi:hypothetical protein
MVMDDQAHAETNAEGHFCPQCGAAENGFFCRNCGALLRGQDRVLCPRCHQVVPDGEYCNQCGQNLSGLALHLQQLALAGDTFWVTSEAAFSPTAPEETSLLPDESVILASPELPDWLHELSAEGVPAEVESHIYPALRPITKQREGTTRNRTFLTVVSVFLFVLIVGLMLLALFILLRGGV